MLEFSAPRPGTPELPAAHWLCKDCSGRPPPALLGNQQHPAGLQGCQVWTSQLLQVCIIRADAIKASILYSVPLEPPALSANFLRFKKVCDATPQAGPGAIPHN